MKKKVDTIKLVRQIRDDNYEKTKQLSRAEQFADIKKKVQKPGKNSCLILKQFKLDFKSILVFTPSKVWSNSPSTVRLIVFPIPC